MPKHHVRSAWCHGNVKQQMNLPCSLSLLSGCKIVCGAGSVAGLAQLIAGVLISTMISVNYIDT